MCKQRAKTIKGPAGPLILDSKLSELSFSLEEAEEHPA